MCASSDFEVFGISRQLKETKIFAKYINKQINRENALKIKLFKNEIRPSIALKYKNALIKLNTLHKR